MTLPVTVLVSVYVRSALYVPSPVIVNPDSMDVSPGQKSGSSADVMSTLRHDDVMCQEPTMFPPHALALAHDPPAPPRPPPPQPASAAAATRIPTVRTRFMAARILRVCEA